MPVTTGNSGFAERIGLCRGPSVGASAELICAERHRLGDLLGCAQVNGNMHEIIPGFYH
jgi:hypothetical protein